MPGHSRVWVYQANRMFTVAERNHLNTELQELCNQWSTHGTPLRASFTLQFDQFVVMAVDEHHQGASGCSIDGSVHFLKSLQNNLGLDFFDRTRVAFLMDQKVVQHGLSELKTLFESKTLSAGTISFDNTVNTKDAWEKGWQVPVGNSWLARYLPKSAVAH